MKVAKQPVGTEVSFEKREPQRIEQQRLGRRGSELTAIRKIVSFPPFQIGYWPLGGR